MKTAEELRTNGAERAKTFYERHRDEILKDRKNRYDTDINYRLYSIHKRMISRCYNPKDKAYHNYGGRGITVAKQWRNNWHTFAKWAIDNGYERGLFIDRTNNDGHYRPSNIRFVTVAQSNCNRRIPSKKSNLPVGVGKVGKKYRAQISIDNEKIYLGLWDTPEEASKQFQCALRVYRTQDSK